ncbi:MAG: hypothetical protein ACYC8T_11490 [Myxococcaceae bacterium]
MPRPLTALCLALLLPTSVLAADSDDEVKKVAEAYLNATTGAGDEGGKDLLLGGATMNAQLFNLENWSIASKDPVRKEEADLGKAVAMMNDLDKAGRSALTKLMGAEAIGDDLTMTEVSQEEALKLMAPTKDKAAKLMKAHPVLAYLARVGKEVYWHPKNPIRGLLAKAGNSGRYQVEVHRWKILSKEGPRQSPREWPLRIVRFKAGKLDTGWKVLPASDWNAE